MGEYIKTVHVKILFIQSLSETAYDTNSRSGPRASLEPLILTVGVVLGPVWSP